MERRQYSLEPIGTIRTPWAAPAGAPIQPSRADGARGVVQLEPAYGEGLRDLEGFERIWLLYVLHRAAPAGLLVTPFLDTQARGVFATRSPARPNALGISVVRLLGVRGLELDVEGVDMVDGTPLVDIKPYVPEFDCYPGARAGWFEAAPLKSTRADGRFSDREG